MQQRPTCWALLVGDAGAEPSQERPATDQRARWQTHVGVHIYARPETPQSQLTVAYGHAQTAGNLDILAIGLNDVTANLTPTPRILQATLTKSAGPMFRGSARSQAIDDAANILSGSNTVTRVMFD